MTCHANSSLDCTDSDGLLWQDPPDRCGRQALKRASRLPVPLQCAPDAMWSMAAILTTYQVAVTRVLSSSPPLLARGHAAITAIAVAALLHSASNHAARPPRAKGDVQAPGLRRRGVLPGGTRPALPFGASSTSPEQVH